MALSPELKQKAIELRRSGASLEEIRGFIISELKETEPLLSPKLSLFQEGLKQTAETVGRPTLLGFPSEAKELGRGILRGATFGTMGGRSDIEGSILEPSSQKFARGAGTVAGSLLPLLASEATGGALLAKGAAKLGAKSLLGVPSIRQGLARAAGTGAAFGGLGEMAQRGTPSEIASGSVKTAALFTGLGISGAGLGFVRKWLGETMPKTAFDSILSISKSKNKTDFEIAGEVIAEKAPNVEGLFGTSSGMLRFVNKKIAKLENKLETTITEAFKKSQKQAPEDVPSLEFNLTEIKPLGIDLVPKEAVFPYVRTVGLPSKTELFREGRKNALLSESVVKLPKVQYPAVPTKPIVDALEIFERHTKHSLGSKRDVKQIKEIKDEFIQRFGENEYLTVPEAQNLKISEYRSIGDKRYAKISQDNPYKFQAKRVVASALRKELGKAVPGLHGINEELGLMYGIRNGLLDRLATSQSGSSPAMRFIYGAAQPAQEAILTGFGRAGRKFFGEPYKIVSPLARTMLRIGVSDSLRNSE